VKLAVSSSEQTAIRTDCGVTSWCPFTACRHPSRSRPVAARRPRTVAYVAEQYFGERALALDFPNSTSLVALQVRVFQGTP
jgi:hypothetical protein